MYKEMLTEFTKIASELNPPDLNEVSLAFLKKAEIETLPMYDFTSEKNIDLGEYMSGVHEDASSEGYRKGIVAGILGLVGGKFALGRGKNIVKQIKDKVSPPPAKKSYKDKLKDMAGRLHPKEAEELCSSLDKIAVADTYTDVLISMDKLASFLAKEDLEVIASSLLEKEAFLGMMGAGVAGAIKGGKAGMNAKSTVNSFNTMYGTPDFHPVSGDLKQFLRPGGGGPSSEWTSMVTSGKAKDIQKAYNEANRMSTQGFMDNVKGGWGKGQQMKTNYDMYMKDPNMVPKSAIKDMEKYYGRPIGPQRGGSGGPGGPPNPPPNFAQSHPYMTAAMAAGGAAMLPRVMGYGPQNNQQGQGAPMPMMTPPMMYYR